MEVKDGNYFITNKRVGYDYFINFSYEDQFEEAWDKNETIIGWKRPILNWIVYCYLLSTFEFYKSSIYNGNVNSSYALLIYMNSSTRLQQLSRHFNPTNIKSQPVRVTVTGAAGNIGYALVHMIG